GLLHGFAAGHRDGAGGEFHCHIGDAGDLADFFGHRLGAVVTAHPGHGVGRFGHDTVLSREVPERVSRLEHGWRAVRRSNPSACLSVSAPEHPTCPFYTPRGYTYTIILCSTTHSEARSLPTPPARTTSTSPDHSPRAKQVADHHHGVETATHGLVHCRTLRHSRRVARAGSSTRRTRGGNSRAARHHRGHRRRTTAGRRPRPADRTGTSGGLAARECRPRTRLLPAPRPDEHPGPGRAMGGGTTPRGSGRTARGPAQFDHSDRARTRAGVFLPRHTT